MFQELCKFVPNVHSFFGLIYIYIYGCVYGQDLTTNSSSPLPLKNTSKKIIHLLHNFNDIVNLSYYICFVNFCVPYNSA